MEVCDPIYEPSFPFVLHPATDQQTTLTYHQDQYCLLIATYIWTGKDTIYRRERKKRKVGILYNLPILVVAIVSLQRNDSKSLIIIGKKSTPIL